MAQESFFGLETQKQELPSFFADAGDGDGLLDGALEGTKRAFISSTHNVRVQMRLPSMSLEFLAASSRTIRPALKTPVISQPQISTLEEMMTSFSTTKTKQMP